MPKQHPLGQLLTCKTDDGSFSLYSKQFNESFHSSAGALDEAKTKFIFPAQLSRFKESNSLNVLDVCVGLGYNTAALLEELQRSSTRLIWWGLEIDTRPLELALQNSKFQSSWSAEVFSILKAIHDCHEWKMNSSEGRILWGDARQKISHLPENLEFDLILLDAFSPNNCPQLWSEEFLIKLATKLAPQGRLLTYCRAAAVRGSLRRAGLELRTISSTSRGKHNWSAGTLAILPENDKLTPSRGAGWEPLSPMEEEHLLTRAAIPYRDPIGEDDRAEILKRRKEEQQNCSMESTSSWQRRWCHDQNGLGH